MLAVSHLAFVLLDVDDQESRVSRWGRLQAHLAHSGTVAAIQVCEALVPDRGDNIHNWYAAYGTHDSAWAARQYTTLLEQTRLSSSTHRTTISLSLDMKAAACGDQSGRRRDRRRRRRVTHRPWRALADQVRQAGLTVHGWLGEAELGAIIRGAYDPEVTLDPLGIQGA